MKINVDKTKVIRISKSGGGYVNKPGKERLEQGIHLGSLTTWNG